MTVSACSGGRGVALDSPTADEATIATAPAVDTTIAPPVAPAVATVPPTAAPVVPSSAAAVAESVVESVDTATFDPVAEEAALRARVEELIRVESEELSKPEPDIDRVLAYLTDPHRTAYKPVLADYIASGVRERLASSPIDRFGWTDPKWEGPNSAVVTYCEMSNMVQYRLSTGEIVDDSLSGGLYVQRWRRLSNGWLFAEPLKTESLTASAACD